MHLLRRVPVRALPRCARVSAPRRPFYSSSSRRSYNNQGYFRFLDDIPQNTVFWGIIGLNGAVFAGFWWAKQKMTVERNPRLYAWMQKNFMANWRNISSGRMFVFRNGSSAGSHRL
jgi:hypothetical protein